MTQFDGLLVLDKPGGMTSRAALDRALSWFPRRTRAGHAGTLDPLATGVLVVCIGAATRLVEYVQDMSKVYRTTLHLGATSDTDDRDGAIAVNPDALPPDIATIRSTVERFIGTIEQVPPAFSAAKVAGQRAHSLARAGAAVVLSPRLVTIYSIHVISYAYPWLDLEIGCGKGTYIRSLARDLGARLGCGALVEELRRTRIGPFECAQAPSLDAEPDVARAALLAPALALAELPRVVVDTNAATRLCQGQAVTVPAGSAQGLVSVWTERGELIAVAHNGEALRAEKVFVRYPVQEIDY